MITEVRNVDDSIQYYYQRSKIITERKGRIEGSPGPGYVNLNYVISRLAREFKLNQKQVKKMCNSIFNVPTYEFTYPEAERFIDTVNSDPMSQFAIWTSGMPVEFQQQKANNILKKPALRDIPIHAAGNKLPVAQEQISNFFDRNNKAIVYIVEDKPSSIFETMEHLKVEQSVNKLVVYYWVMQGRHAQSFIDDFLPEKEPDEMITDLDRKQALEKAQTKMRNKGVIPIDSIADMATNYEKLIAPAYKEYNKLVLCDLDDTLIDTKQVLNWIFTQWREIISNRQIQS